MEKLFHILNDQRDAEVCNICLKMKMPFVSYSSILSIKICPLRNQIRTYCSKWLLEGGEDLMSSSPVLELCTVQRISPGEEAEKCLKINKNFFCNNFCYFQKS